MSKPVLVITYGIPCGEVEQEYVERQAEAEPEVIDLYEVGRETAAR